MKEYRCDLLENEAKNGFRTGKNKHGARYRESFVRSLEVQARSHSARGALRHAELNLAIPSERTRENRMARLDLPDTGKEGWHDNSVAQYVNQCRERVTPDMKPTTKKRLTREFQMATISWDEIRKARTADPIVCADAWATIAARINPE